MSNGTKHERTPQGTHEEWLVRIGWNMVGLSLWQYPNSDNLRDNYTTDKAIAISEELGLDLYCTACGSCGTDGCCSPDRCKCLHRDQHNTDYETLLRENEKYYNFIKSVADIRNDEGFIVKYIRDAKALIGDEYYANNMPDGDMYPVHKDDRLGRDPLK